MVVRLDISFANAPGFFLRLGCYGFFTHYVCSWRQMVIMPGMVCRDVLFKRHCVQFVSPLSLGHMALELAFGFSFESCLENNRIVLVFNRR